MSKNQENAVAAAVRRLVPRAHQAEAVAAAKAELEIADRATLVMASGAGKTATGVWSASAVIGDARRAVIVVFFPSLALIRQTIPVWIDQQNWGNRFHFLAVCSDQSVVDDDISPRDMPYPTTTQSADIAKFIGTRGVRVVFATYHSSEAVAAALRDTGTSCDLAIFDEAHRTAGSPGRTLSAPLSDDVLPCKKRLFMTATPRVTNRKKRNRDGDAQVISMDDESIYGRIAYRLSFREAAARGIICTYRVLVSTVTTAELGAEPGDVTVDVDGVRLSLEDAASRVALARAIEMVDARKVITFHANVVDATRFVGKDGVGKMLPGFETYHVNGMQPTQYRDAAIDKFAGAERGLVSNARCLTEGVDIPAVDLVAFINRKKSKVDIIQAIGRAMRKPYGSDKQVGYVLLPILLDSAKTVEDAMADADLSVMFDVLSALKDEDEVLAEVISKTAGAAPGEPRDLSEFVEVLGSAIDIDRVHHAVDVSILDELATSFDFNFGLLRRFVEREGHSRVHQHHVENGMSLGAWVSYIRKRKEILTGERIAVLENMPGWAWNAEDYKFDIGFSHLLKFVHENGHSLVPDTHIENGFKLGRWVTHKRRYKEGLPTEKKEKFEALPCWTWSVNETKYLTGLSYLKEFVSREGHANVPERHIEDNFKLGQWVSNKRRSIGELPIEKRQELEGFPGWRTVRQDNPFSTGLSYLKEFFTREGHARVPYNHVEGNYKLGQWVSGQRRHKNRLTFEKTKELESFPGWTWSAKKTKKTS
jgi:superfamily II DNA or RNA helicase